MVEKDKSALECFAAALLVLPEGKRQYLQGVADGMAAMTERTQSRPAPPTFPPTSGPEGGPTPVGCPAP